MVSSMKFVVLPVRTKTPSSGFNTAYLRVDRWDDYSYVTMFYLELHDDHGNLHSLGELKIGFQGQEVGNSTYASMDDKFEALSEKYFSVGQDVDYYKKLVGLPESIRVALLKALRDIVYEPKLIDLFQDEDVFKTSLLRSVSLSVIKGQFCRVLSGQAELTNYNFKFAREKAGKVSAIDLGFNVRVGSTPNTNIHAIIGRNGVGKTTLLNGMIEAVTREQDLFQFYDLSGWGEHPIDSDYFSSLVSVSFSAFDPFEPPAEQPNPSAGTCYFYIGLKDSSGSLKSLSAIKQDFSTALGTCLSQVLKRERWLNALKILESDENFASMGLSALAELSGEKLAVRANKIIDRMSSGHTVVLLTITRLVAAVEEKTLVLIDEPESHLHPPLLSAFIRALSDLLHDRNGVSIIATHSPVVLQEVPASCVWKLNRYGSSASARRPDVETFGENVGILTREVFGLEVVKSGFHDLLVKSVEAGGSYEGIVEKYGGQLGLEARALLKALVINRDKGAD